MATQTRRASTAWFVPTLALDILAAAAMVAVVWAGLVYAAPAANLAGAEQAAQRIFYFHMGCNIAALLGFAASVIGSLGYLITRNLFWDRMAQAGVEVGTIFGIGVIVSGSLWARPAWNTYWTWDPRLTTATITVLIYLAYLLFRNGIDNRHTRARFASIYALIAFLSVPLTYYSARWFRSIHPVVLTGENPDAQGGFGLGPSMRVALFMSMAGFAVLFLSLWIHRIRQLGLQDRIQELREELYR